MLYDGKTLNFYYEVKNKPTKIFHVTYHNLKTDVSSVNIIEKNMSSFNKR